MNELLDLWLYVLAEVNLMISDKLKFLKDLVFHVSFVFDELISNAVKYV